MLKGEYQKYQLVFIVSKTLSKCLKCLRRVVALYFIDGVLRLALETSIFSSWLQGEYLLDSHTSASSVRRESLICDMISHNLRRISRYGEPSSLQL